MNRFPPPLRALLRLPGMPTVAAPLIVALAAGLGACAGSSPAYSGPPRTLEGQWQVARLDGRVAAGQTLDIDAEGRVSGHAGCNRYVSSIDLRRDGALTFTPAAATKMACVDEGKMAAEVAFLRMLDAVRSVRSRGTSLLLLDEADQVIAELTAQE